MSAKALRYTLVVRHPETGAATALLEGEQVPDWASDLVHADDLVSQGKPAKPGYDTMTVEQLKAEVDARNEGRDRDAVLSKYGTKAELVAALQADDR